MPETKKAYRADSRWENECKRILSLVESGDEETFPPEDDVNKLVYYTEKAFSNTPFLQHAMDRVFDIRKKWLTQNRKMERAQMVEDKVLLSEVIAGELKNILTKIAVENNIKMADSIRIKMSSVDGTITFLGVE